MGVRRSQSNDPNAFGHSRSRLLNARWIAHTIDLTGESLSGKPPKRKTQPNMCPYCGVVSHRTVDRDPVSGYCAAQKACIKRRSELDDETIEFLELVPREAM